MSRRPKMTIDTLARYRQPLTSAADEEEATEMAAENYSCWAEDNPNHDPEKTWQEFLAVARRVYILIISLIGESGGCNRTARAALVPKVFSVGAACLSQPCNKCVTGA